MRGSGLTFMSSLILLVVLSVRFIVHGLSPFLRLRHSGFDVSDMRASSLKSSSGFKVSFSLEV